MTEDPNKPKNEQPFPGSDDDRTGGDPRQPSPDKQMSEADDRLRKDGTLPTEAGKCGAPISREGRSAPQISGWQSETS